MNSDIDSKIETYYIFRIYYLPVLLLFILIKNKDIFNLKFYKKIITILIGIISLSIVILNIFKLSYATYAAENSEFVKYNIFDFYKSSESPKLLSTRGWFDSSNEISAILMILFPINIYMLFKDKKKFYKFLYAIQFLAMIILGTRVAAIGAILITICSIIINIIFRFVSKEKINYQFILLGILCSLYFFMSPIGVYMLGYPVPNYNIEDEHSEYVKKLSDSSEIANYINNHLYDFRIDEYFVKIYPVIDDVPFWVKIALRNRNLNNDSRVMKSTIINRIQERNDNKYDKLLGMGYTTYFIDLERDYVYQYYLFGVCGIILIVPGLFTLIRNMWLLFKKRKIIDMVSALLILMAPVLGYVVAYYSGHVFGWVSPSYILILVVAFLNYMMSTNMGCER